MHELSLAQSILNSIISTAKKNSANIVLEADLEVGEACPVNAKQLIPLIIRLAENTAAENMSLNILDVKAQVRCNSCLQTGVAIVKEDAEPGDHRLPICECSYCGSQDVVVVNGTEMKVKTIKVALESAS